MNQDEAAAELSGAAALWSVGYVGAADVVRAACDALAAGLDTEALRELAAVSYQRVDLDAPELLAAALAELDLAYHHPGSRSGQAAAVTVLAARVLAGQLPPRDLASWAHRTIGHDQLALAERLVDLDDVYDTALSTPAEIDADVIAEARRIVGADR